MLLKTTDLGAKETLRSRPPNSSYLGNRFAGETLRTRGTLTFHVKAWNAVFLALRSAFCGRNSWSRRGVSSNFRRIWHLRNEKDLSRVKLVLWTGCSTTAGLSSVCCNFCDSSNRNAGYFKVYTFKKSRVIKTLYVAWGTSLLEKVLFLLEGILRYYNAQLYTHRERNAILRVCQSNIMLPEKRMIPCVRQRSITLKW